MQQYEDRIERLERQVESLTASRDANRKLLWLVIPSLVGALATVLVFSAEKVASSSERAGEIKATLDAEKEQRQSMEREIEQLRTVLLRVTGADIKPLSIVRYP